MEKRFSFVIKFFQRGKTPFAQYLFVFLLSSGFVYSKSPSFYLDSNGVTIKCSGSSASKIETDPLVANSFPQDFSNPSLRATIEIVNFFSPNGDGINDSWQIKEIDRYLNNQIWIYSRTGRELFSAKPYYNNWQGVLDGVPLPAGSYYYRIDLDGNGSIDFEGWFYLTR